MNSVLRRQYLQEMVKALPPVVQNRIVALKNLQLEFLEIETQFFEEVYKLEKEYHLKFQPLFSKRKEIVNGAVDPKDEKPKWKESESANVGEGSEDFGDSLKSIKSMPQDVKGIPDFWLTVFRNTAMLSEMVQTHDEPALRKLTDIVIKYDNAVSIVFYLQINVSNFL